MEIDVTKRDPAKAGGPALELRLADFIRQEREAVIAEWVTFAKTRVPPGENMTQLALRDHIVEILDFIAHDLESAQSDEEQADKSKGDGPLRTPIHRSAAEVHAALRLRHGFNIDQMVGARCVWLVWAPRTATKMSLRIRRSNRYQVESFGGMTSGFLIVDDEFLHRAHAAEFMEDAGFSVYEASNADEAMALLELHHDIRAVFTDIQMPGSRDGLKLAHYIPRKIDSYLRSCMQGLCQKTCLPDARFLGSLQLESEGHFASNARKVSELPDLYRISEGMTRLGIPESAGF
jgi:hypothetical protein